MIHEKFENDVHSTVDRINLLVANDFHSRGPQWVKAWYSLSLGWSETDPEYVVFPEGAVARLLEMAAVDREVFELATFAAGTRLACGADFNRELRDFVSEYLKGNISPPKAGAGRPRKQTWGRDFIIIDAMRYLGLSLEIPMTQNIIRKSKRDHETTASEIVEEAIGLSDLYNLDRVQIERIWRRVKMQNEYEETIQLRNDSLLDDANDIVRS